MTPKPHMSSNWSNPIYFSIKVTILEIEICIWSLVYILQDNFSHGQQYILPLLAPTPTVFSTDGITIETRSTSFTVVTSGVSPAVQALARHIIALIEDKVRV